MIRRALVPLLPLLAAAALPLAGCIGHFHMDQGAPGAPQAAGGRIMPRGVLEPPSDPGEVTTVVTLGVIGGLGADLQDTREPDPNLGDGAPGSYVHIGAELTVRRATLEQSHRGTAIDEAYKAQTLRPVLGWTLVRAEGQSQARETRLGPGYLQLVYEPLIFDVAPSFSIGGGLAWDLSVPTLGPQATGCFLMFTTLGGGMCVQGAFFPYRGTDLQFNLLLRGHLELISTR